MKTTITHVLLGIVQASEGEARLFGMDAWKNAIEIHKRIAYVSGDVNLNANIITVVIVYVLLALVAGLGLVAMSIESMDFSTFYHIHDAFCWGLIMWFYLMR